MTIFSVLSLFIYTKSSKNNENRIEGVFIPTALPSIVCDVIDAWDRGAWTRQSSKWSAVSVLQQRSSASVHGSKESARIQRVWSRDISPCLPGECSCCICPRIRTEKHSGISQLHRRTCRSLRGILSVAFLGARAADGMSRVLLFLRIRATDSRETCAERGKN
jgi:hypothetical protein